MSKHFLPWLLCLIKNFFFLFLLMIIFSHIFKFFSFVSLNPWINNCRGWVYLIERIKTHWWFLSAFCRISRVTWKIMKKKIDINFEISQSSLAIFSSTSTNSTIATWEAEKLNCLRLIYDCITFFLCNLICPRLFCLESFLTFLSPFFCFF